MTQWKSVNLNSATPTTGQNNHFEYYNLIPRIRFHYFSSMIGSGSGFLQSDTIRFAFFLRIGYAFASFQGIRIHYYKKCESETFVRGMINVKLWVQLFSSILPTVSRYNGSYKIDRKWGSCVLLSFSYMKYRMSTFENQAF